MAVFVCFAISCDENHLSLLMAGNRARPKAKANEITEHVKNRLCEQNIFLLFRIMLNRNCCVLQLKKVVC